MLFFVEIINDIISEYFLANLEGYEINFFENCVDYANENHYHLN